MNQDITLLVTTCNKYADLLPITIELLNKYWHDCDLKKICVIDYVTDELKETLSFFDEVVSMGQEVARGKNLLRLRKALKIVDTPYVMMMQEDFFLYDYVNNNDIERIVHFAREHHAGTISLINQNSTLWVNPSPSKKPYSIEKSPLDMPYRISMRNIFWNTDYFSNLTQKYDSPGDFERMGSAYSASLPEAVYTISGGREVFPNIDAINRGKWRVGSTAFLQRECLTYDREKWLELTKTELLITLIRNFIYTLSPKIVTKIVAHFPWRKKY